MNAVLKRTAQGGFVAAILIAALAWDGQAGPVSVPTLTSPAQARVGNPLTPVSYAGVARRTTRRAVVATSAAAPPPPPPQQTTVVVQSAAPAATCTVVVDTEGNVVQPCP